MLKSLFNVANKVSTVSQNENELAKKVENMVNQAGNIQKATQITKELLQSINEVSAELKKNAQSVQALNMTPLYWLMMLMRLNYVTKMLGL